MTTAFVTPAHRQVVVMGVSGCGKTTLGEALAKAWGCEYVEGDRYHSPENVARMAAGIALTWLAMPMIRGQLFGVQATDPLTFAAVIGLFLAVAIVAAFMPARRAAHAQPADALRA